MCLCLFWTSVETSSAMHHIRELLDLLYFNNITCVHRSLLALSVCFTNFHVIDSG